jgi:anti-anti-sigma regulatory factor
MRTQPARRHDSHDEPPDREPTVFAAGLIMNRSGRRAHLGVTGQLSDITRRHLDDWLNWLIMTGARQVTVALAGPDQIDTQLLRVLGVAQARLQDSDAELVVTAAGLPMRSEFRVIGQAC